MKNFKYIAFSFLLTGSAVLTKSPFIPKIIW